MKNVFLNCVWRWFLGRVWREGHEEGWNDCLLEIQRQEKLRNDTHGR
jgi:hypothetical protein